MPQNDPKMSTKIAKKDKKKQNKKDAVNQKLKNNKDSDSDDDYEDEDWSEEEDEEVNMHEIRKQIAKILPSKHINKKTLNISKGWQKRYLMNIVLSYMTNIICCFVSKIYTIHSVPHFISIISK